MRALAKSLFVILLLACPQFLLAQAEDPLGLGRMPGGNARVLPAQYEDLLDPIIPAPEEEAKSASSASTSASDAPAVQPTPPEPIAADPAPAPMPSTFVEDGELIYDEGHYYDLPVADAIHEDVTEIYSTNNWFRGGHWYSKQEFMMMVRTKISPVHVAVDTTESNIKGGFVDGEAAAIPSPFVNSSINTLDSNFSYEPGARITLGHMLGRDVANRDHGFELSFFGLFEYSGRATLIPHDPNLTSGITSLLASPEVDALVDGVLGGIPVLNSVEGFFNSRFQEMVYEADFNSFEANYTIGARPNRDRLVMQPDGRWVRHATPSLVRGMFAGLRYVRQHEKFLHAAESGYNRFFDPQISPDLILLQAVDGGGTYQVATENDLFGIQFGGEIVRKRTDWVLGLNGRVGGLVNFARRESRLVQTFDDDLTTEVNLNTDVTTESVDDETLAFLGEAGAYAAYYIRPNTSLRCGYNVLFMNGIATAPDNVGLAGGFTAFETTGKALYHGLNLGFEMTW